MDDRTADVLEYLTGQGAKSGAEISRDLKISSGTLYPILVKLEGSGAITRDWSDGDIYPRRRVYAVTDVNKAMEGSE